MKKNHLRLVKHMVANIVLLLAAMVVPLPPRMPSI